VGTHVDAVTGEVLGSRNRLIKESGRNISFGLRIMEERPSPGQKLSLIFLFRIGRKRSEDMKLMAQNTADGTALVFDPDPRTTLMNDTIEDTDPAETFTPAYQLRTLRDITERTAYTA